MNMVRLRQKLEIKLYHLAIILGPGKIGGELTDDEAKF